MSVEVILHGLENNPQCFHGPCLLFRRNKGRVKEYYACSACRDHKDCPFFLDASEIGTKKRNISKWAGIRAQTLQNIMMKNPYKKYVKILKSMKGKEKISVNFKNTSKKSISEHKSELHNKKIINFTLPVCMGDKSNKQNNVNSSGFCYSCNELFDKNDFKNHKTCNVILNLTKYQLKHPTEILIPEEDSKTQAQYFFSNETVKNISLLLTRMHITRVLCIGAPRIHEYLLNEFKNQFQSILLDIDLKYYNFYSEKQFIWYNMFNNYMLKEGSINILKEFMQSDKVIVVMDPPFGGRVEPLSHTLQALNDLYFQINGIEGSRGIDDDRALGIMWMFPYFMEHHIKMSLPNFNMFDLKINYENHSSFTNMGHKKRKHGSPIRIFTNIPLSQFNLEGVDGYKFCSFCGYWVSEENRHCTECNSCTSKNGTTYIHCSKCSRCFKPSYKHCDTCRKCALVDHDCLQIDQSPKCFHCKSPGHRKRECPDIRFVCKAARRRNNRKKNRIVK